MCAILASDHYTCFQLKALPERPRDLNRGSALRAALPEPIATVQRLRGEFSALRAAVRTPAAPWHTGCREPGNAEVTPRRNHMHVTEAQPENKKQGPFFTSEAFPKSTHKFFCQSQFHLSYSLEYKFFRTPDVLQRRTAYARQVKAETQSKAVTIPCPHPP